MDELWQSVCVCVCTLLAPTEATVYVNGEVVLIDGERVAAVGTPPPAVVHALDVTSHSYTRSLRSFFQALLLLLLLSQLIHSVPDFLSCSTCFFGCL